MTRRYCRSAAAAVTLFALLAGAASAREQSGDMMIVPGERVGALAIGMTEMQMIAAAGEPDRRASQGRDNLYNWGLLTARIGAASSTVEEIVINDPRYLTGGRVHVGSTDLAVTANFGQPKKRARLSGLDTLDYDGISIVQQNGMVMQLRVRK